MKRGGPLKRTELKRGSSELRRTPMKRTSKLSKTRRGPHRDWWKVRAQVLDRDGGRCEARFSPDCTGRAVHVHHIQLRSCGGTDDPWNLLGVCDECHTGSRGIHARPMEAYAAGWLVHG